MTEVELDNLFEQYIEWKKATLKDVTRPRAIPLDFKKRLADASNTFDYARILSGTGLSESALRRWRKIYFPEKSAIKVHGAKKLGFTEFSTVNFVSPIKIKTPPSPKEFIILSSVATPARYLAEVFNELGGY